MALLVVTNINSTWSELVFNDLNELPQFNDKAFVLNKMLINELVLSADLSGVSLMIGDGRRFDFTYDMFTTPSAVNNEELYTKLKALLTT